MGYFAFGLQATVYECLSNAEYGSGIDPKRQDPCGNTRVLQAFFDENVSSHDPSDDFHLFGSILFDNNLPHRVDIANVAKSAANICSSVCFFVYIGGIEELVT